MALSEVGVPGFTSRQSVPRAQPFRLYGPYDKNGFRLMSEFWLCHLAVEWEGKLPNFSKFSFPYLKMRMIMALTLHFARREWNSAGKELGTLEDIEKYEFLLLLLFLFLLLCKRVRTYMCSCDMGKYCSPEKRALTFLISFWFVFETAFMFFVLVGCLLSLFDAFGGQECRL